MALVIMGMNKKMEGREKKTVTCAGIVTLLQLKSAPLVQVCVHLLNFH